MEGIAACKRQLETLIDRATAQTMAIEALADVFAQEAVGLLKRDQARRLYRVKGEVITQVAHVQSIEEATRCGFSEGRFINGILKLVAGSLGAAMSRSREHPLLRGARIAAREFERIPPFGTVVVAVGPGGVPDDIVVVPVSRLARESSRPESAIIAELKSRGHLVLTPREFSNMLDDLVHMVLEGTAALPATSDKLEKIRQVKGSQSQTHDVHRPNGA